MLLVTLKSSRKGGASMVIEGQTWSSLLLFYNSKWWGKRHSHKQVKDAATVTQLLGREFHLHLYVLWTHDTYSPLSLSGCSSSFSESKYPWCYHSHQSIHGFKQSIILVESSCKGLALHHRQYLERSSVSLLDSKLLERGPEQHITTTQVLAECLAQWDWDSE